MAERALATAYVNLVPGTKDLDAYLKGRLGDDVEKSTSDAGDRGGKAFASSMMSSFKGLAVALGATLGTVAIVDFVKQSVTAASDLNEAGTAVTAIFGDATGKINTWAKTAATSLGQSNKQALDAAKTFGIYGQAAGLSASANADFSMSLAGLATDFASFYNASPAEAIDAIGAALRGENEPIRRFGVLLDEATLKNQALKMGLITSTKEALQPQVKVMAAYQAILAQTGTAQGDFARTSEGLANQQRIAAAQFENFKAQLGNALLPVAIAVTTFFNTTFIPMLYGVVDGIGAIWNLLVNGDFTTQFGQIFHVGEDSTVVDTLLTIRDAVIDAVGTMIDTSKSLFDFMAANSSWLEPLAVGVTAFVGALTAWNYVTNIGTALQTGYAAASYGAAAATYAVGTAQKIGALWYALMNSAIVTNTIALMANESLTIGTKIAILASAAATGIATAATWLFNAALMALGGPIGLIIAAVVALVAGLVWFFTQTELGQQIWQGFVDALATAWNWFYTNVIIPVIEGIAQFFTWLWETIIKPIVQGIVLYVIIWGAIFTWLYENIVKPVFGLIGEIFKWIYENIIVPVINKIVASIQAWGAVFNWLYENIIRPVFQGIGSIFNWLWTNVIQKVIDWIVGAFNRVGDSANSVFGGLGDLVRGAFEGLIGIIRGPVNAIIDLMNGMIDHLNNIRIDIPSWAQDLFGGASSIGFNIPHIPKLAKGGYVDQPTTALIGEAGPEVVTPLKDFERMMGLNGNGNGNTVNYYAAPNQSIDAEQALFTALKRAKVLGAW